MRRTILELLLPVQSTRLGSCHFIDSVLSARHLSDHFQTMMMYSNSPQSGEAGSLFI